MPMLKDNKIQMIFLKADLINSPLISSLMAIDEF